MVGNTRLPQQPPSFLYLKTLYSLAQEPPNTVRSILVSGIDIISNLFCVFLEFVARWSNKIWNAFHELKPEDLLRKDMASSRTYEEWSEKAAKLDLDCGNDDWKANPESRFYDYNLIQSRLQHLKEVRQTGDVMAMIYLLRSGLLRNLGGMCDAKLYYKSPLGYDILGLSSLPKSQDFNMRFQLLILSHDISAMNYISTKQLIEDYMQEVVSQLDHIAATNFSELNPQAKLDFFNDTRQSFGCSALVLHGGSAFGLYHLGVVKALNQAGLLPRIISGTSVGALMAALICIHTDSELPVGSVAILQSSCRSGLICRRNIGRFRHFRSKG
ncbi:hypothetical protein BC938DRAFT_482709 [Jimgerdemannia flammicorona]|uniref:PNPLA domain-containing protein n=1 Tax=Jimgerdemannia flammicorona TaxID=994334 RepID=A0A433QW71_9FUNG|nr:hypothetical protein BC938DRAFT_482709 [Jimgerdemannia flammicorona]